MMVTSTALMVVVQVVRLKLLLAEMVPLKLGVASNAMITTPAMAMAVVQAAKLRLLQ
jgi:hypothetical protein